MGRVSRWPLEFDFRDGLDRNGLPVIRSGQTPTFVRGGTTRTCTAVDRNGVNYFVGSSLPRFHHRLNESTGLWDAVGLLLEGAESGHAAEIFTVPYRRRLGALTLYVRFWRGTHDVPGAIVAQLGGVAGVRLVIAESADSGYSAMYTDGAQAYTSTVATRLPIGTQVELRVVLDPLAANGIILYQSVDSAPEETGSASGAIATRALAAALGTPALAVGSDGTGSRHAANAYAGVVIGAGQVLISDLRPVDAPADARAPSVRRLTEAGIPRLTEAGLPRYTE
jgi:hypothetical protein